MGIVAEHKYYTENKRFDLFSRVIDAISPTYDIEIRSIVELCGVDKGLGSISDRREQNILLRKMLSVAPKERVPRHRLIRNLIALGEYDPAEIEIRLFERDFRLDGPAARYKIDLALSRVAARYIQLKEQLRDADGVAHDRVRRILSSRSLLRSYRRRVDDAGLTIDELLR